MNMQNGVIVFLTQNGEEKKLDLCYDEQIPQLSGGYTKDDVLCIAGQHIDWEAVDEYGWSLDSFTKPTWTWK